MAGMLRTWSTVVLVAVFICFPSTTDGATKHIVFGLDWQISGRHAGYVVAAEKGFYRDEGLEVELQRGYGSADVVKRVASGTLTFGFGDIGSLVIARSEGLPVKAIAVIYARGAYGLWMRKESQIRTPRDLEGKVIAATAGSAIPVLFPAFAARNGVDPKKVKWLTVDSAAQFPMLLAGRVDVTADMMTGWPTAAKRAHDAGVPLQAMAYYDYGVDIYGNGLLARDSTIRDEPDLVRRFTRATLRGLQYSFDHPEEAASIVARRYPEIDVDTAIEEITFVRDLAESREAKTHGLGYMAPERIDATRDVIVKSYQLKVTVPSDDLFTNAFLPGSDKST